jgi:hypothetical protein
MWQANSQESQINQLTKAKQGSNNALKELEGALEEKAYWLILKFDWDYLTGDLD